MHCLVKHRFAPCFFSNEKQTTYYSTNDKRFTSLNFKIKDIRQGW